MVRKFRVESNTGLYHVLNRGNYRSDIFESEGAKVSFVKTLFEACERFSWKLSGFCLMTNHYHLCIGTPRGNLSNGMRWLQSTFAARFNKYRKERGHLFQGRFKSIAVEPGEHWLKLVDYIHLNPVQVGLVDLESIGRYPWTSLFYFPKRSSRPGFLDCEWMDYFSDFDDSKGGWVRYINHLRLEVSEDPKEVEELDRQMCRGWSLGSKKFGKAVAAELKITPAVLRLDRIDLALLNETLWEASLTQCLSHLRKTTKDAQKEKRSVDWKLAIASKLKRETAVTNAWLTKHLEMGATRSVSAICGVYQREKESSCPQAKALGNLIIDY
ncbi:MAG: transposase [Verrucomicrobia bacterium]|nr:transposase [Verrucomicrobiota bacterium]